jgi:uncharacterized protein (DUF1499 family)
MKPPSTRLSALPVGVALIGFLLLAVAGPAYRLGLLALETAYGVMRWGAYVGAAAIIAGLILGTLAYRQRKGLATTLALTGVVLGLVAVIPTYAWQRRLRTAPPIQDLTTDLDNPPAFVAIAPLRTGADVALDRAPLLVTQQRDGYPDLAPVTLSLPPDRVFNRALDVIQRLGWETVDSDQAAGRIEATDTSAWFGFKDDVVVRVTPWGTGARVDVRSVSRLRRNDGGEGAQRIRDFLDALQAD